MGFGGRPSLSSASERVPQSVRSSVTVRSVCCTQGRGYGRREAKSIGNKYEVSSVDREGRQKRSRIMSVRAVLRRQASTLTGLSKSPALNRIGGWVGEKRARWSGKGGERARRRTNGRGRTTVNGII